eukprot:8631869-Pyramimonas_sp.AAC.1
MRPIWEIFEVGAQGNDSSCSDVRAERRGEGEGGVGEVGKVPQLSYRAVGLLERDDRSRLPQRARERASASFLGRRPAW